MPNPKHYARPKTLAEALELAKPGSIALVGGAMTLDSLDVSFEMFVDLQDIPELKQIVSLPKGYRIGSTVTLQQLVELPDLHPVLRRAVIRTIPLNIRNNTSVVESLTKMRPLEWMAALAALDVGVEQLKFDGTQETHAIAEWLHAWDVGKRRDGIITAVDLTFYEGHEQALGAAFVARTPTDEPIVCAAVYVRLDQAGLIDIFFPIVGGLIANGVQNVAYVMETHGQPLTEATINSILDGFAFEEIISDYRGSAEYRREMARVCLKRALLECLEQLEG